MTNRFVLCVTVPYSFHWVWPSAMDYILAHVSCMELALLSAYGLLLALAQCQFSQDEIITFFYEKHGDIYNLDTCTHIVFLTHRNTTFTFSTLSDAADRGEGGEGGVGCNKSGRYLHKIWIPSFRNLGLKKSLFNNVLRRSKYCGHSNFSVTISSDVPRKRLILGW